MELVKAVFLSVVVTGGAITAPMNLTVLPVETYIEYADLMGVKLSTEEKKEIGKLPQHYADMHGWEDLVAAVVRAYNSLSPEEQSQCAIFTGNYGAAGAIDFYGRKYHLPKTISGYNNYWLWGPGQYTGGVVIHLGGPSEEILKTMYDELEQAERFTNEYCMPFENNMVIYICRRLKAPLKEIWPRVKNFN